MIDPADDEGFLPRFARAHPIARSEADRLAGLLGVEPSAAFHVALHIAISFYVEEVIAEALHGAHNDVGFRVLSEISERPDVLLGEEIDGPESAWCVALLGTDAAVEMEDPTAAGALGAIRRVERIQRLAAETAETLRPKRGGGANGPRRRFAACLLDLAEAHGARLGLGSKEADGLPKHGVMPLADAAFHLAAEVGQTVLQCRSDLPPEAMRIATHEFHRIEQLGVAGLRRLLVAVK